MNVPVDKAENANGFWQSRTGWSRLKSTLLLEPLPGGSRWAAAFGSLLLFTFLLQAITGILLAANYAPAVKTSWPSVKFIQEQVPLGWFIRSVHHWGASLMIILVLLHLIQVYVWGAYKRPRELTWMVGVLLLGCTVGLAFTGYLLPWDDNAYWATRVGLGIVSTTPLVGDWLRALLQGGADLGNLTLTHFFTLHAFALPILLVLLATVHLYLFRIHGVTPPFWASEEQLKAQEEPFWPGQALKDAVVALVFLWALGIWCLYYAAPLGPQANPAQPFEARPEWYFMFLFRLLRYFEGPWEVVGTFVLPAAFFVALFLWPFLDRNSARDPRWRPIAIGLLVLGTAALLGSTIYAIATDVRLPLPATAQALEPDKPAPAGPMQRFQIAAVYRENCVACHGEDGSGSPVRAAMPTIPDFRNMAWQMAKTELEIVHQIQDGKEPVMPAFRGKISQDQIIGLAIYLRAFALGPATVAQPKPTPEGPAPQTVPKPAEVLPKKEKTQQPAAKKAGPLAAEVPPAATKEPTLPSHEPPIAPLPSSQLFRDYCLACHGADGRGAAVRAAMPEIPDFADAKWQKSRTDADLNHSILDGKGKFMLPMKSKVGVVGADGLVAYIRKFAAAKTVVPAEQSLPGPTKAAAKPVKPEAQPRAAKTERLPVPTVALPAKPAQPAKGPEISPVAPPDRTTERVHFAVASYREYCLTCHGVDGHGADMRAAFPTIPNFTDSAWQRAHTNGQLIASITNGKNAMMPAFGDRLSDNTIRDLVAYVRAFGPPAQEAASAESEQQFRELQRQWKELERQIQELSPPERKRK